MAPYGDDAVITPTAPSEKNAAGLALGALQRAARSNAFKASGVHATNTS